MKGQYCSDMAVHFELMLETTRDESCHEMLMSCITSSPQYGLNFDMEIEERKVCHFEFSSVWKIKTEVSQGAGFVTACDGVTDKVLK